MRRRNSPLLYLLAALMLAAVFFVALLEQSSLSESPEPPLESAVPTPVETLAPGPIPIPIETPTMTPAPSSPLAGKLRVTEIMEKNRAALRDEDGDFPDWIELANLSDEKISLEGFRIADREGRLGWVFPERSLNPGERLLVFASRKDRDGGELHTNFALSAYDYVLLYDAEGLVVDSAPCCGTEADVVTALDADRGWVQSLYPTPGYANTHAGYEAWQRTLLPAGPLAISEAVVKNFSQYVAGSSYDCDWVEIKNISDQPVLLSDYFLSDKDEEPFRWQLPEETLAPGAYTLFVCEPYDSGFYGSTPCTGFSLNSSNEQLYLTSAAGELIDYASLRDIPADGSYGRMDGEAGFFYFAAPTPAKPNLGGQRRVSAMPVALTKDGVFEDVESVTLELAGDGVLRYTINGSAPTEKSELYTEPLEIGETCVVSVRSFEKGALPSRPLVLCYILNEGHDLPVVCFTAENVRDFSGYYDAGSKFHEMPGSLSFYRGDEHFTINCGVSLNGETSLSMPKKNMAVRFRGAYGAPILEHDIFGGGVTAFTDLLLRAGQDQYQSVIRNELAQSLAEKADTAVINQRSIFCVLYLNGKYAGLYTIKERPNASLYAAVAGVEKDSVECIEAPAPYESDFYNATVDFVNKNDMSLDENYAQFCETMDIDSLIDWLILEGFCANTDLTSGNLRYARSNQADGKWHLLFYDLDAAFRSFYSIQTNLLNNFGASHYQVASFAVPLMKNAAFRDQLLSRAAELLRGPLSNEAVLAEIDSMADEIRSEVQRDFKRYSRELSSWEKAIEDLRSMIRDSDWRQANIEGLCQSFELDSETRAHYFGDIDANPPKPEEVMAFA